MRKRAKIPSRPAPRTAGGKPDLSGVWLVTDDPYPEQPAALPWAASLANDRAANNRKDHLHNRCLPGSPPVPGSSVPFIAKFVQTPSLLMILFEDVPGFRQVFLDGRGHRPDVARCGGSAREPSAGRKNNAIPVELGARVSGGAELDRAAKGLRTRDSDDHRRGAAAARITLRWFEGIEAAKAEAIWHGYQ